MLTMIKEYINNLPDSSFQKFFMDYIFSVQDDIIKSELRFLCSRNSLTVDSMEYLIKQTYERGVKI